MGFQSFVALPNIWKTRTHAYETTNH